MGTLYYTEDKEKEKEEEDAEEGGGRGYKVGILSVVGSVTSVCLYEGKGRGASLPILPSPCEV